MRAQSLPSRPRRRPPEFRRGFASTPRGPIVESAAAAREAAERVERVKAETRIVSRYGVSREVDALAKVLAAMSWRERRLIEQVTIDSKASWLIQVTLREENADDAERIAGSVEAGMLAEIGGHNGVSVVGLGSQVFVSGCWVATEETRIRGNQ